VSLKKGEGQEGRDTCDELGQNQRKARTARGLSVLDPAAGRNDLTASSQDMLLARWCVLNSATGAVAEVLHPDLRV
jgi:hypothetical protein